jgi:hypothetical protein
MDDVVHFALECVGGVDPSRFVGGIGFVSRLSRASSSLAWMFHAIRLMDLQAIPAKLRPCTCLHRHIHISTCRRACADSDIDDHGGWARRNVSGMNVAASPRIDLADAGPKSTLPKRSVNNRAATGLNFSITMSISQSGLGGFRTLAFSWPNRHLIGLSPICTAWRSGTWLRDTPFLRREYIPK